MTRPSLPMCVLRGDGTDTTRRTLSLLQVTTTIVNRQFVNYRLPFGIVLPVHEAADRMSPTEVILLRVRIRSEGPEE